MKKFLTLAVAAIVMFGLTAANTLADRPSQQQEEPLSPTITLPSGKVINAPILKYLPTEDGWLADIDEGLKLAQKENKKVILLFALAFRNNQGMTKGYLASHYVEQPQFKEAVKDKYILVYYWQKTITPELRTKYNIGNNWQMDMIILDQNGKELAREQEPGPDVNYLINFVNSVQSSKTSSGNEAVTGNPHCEELAKTEGGGVYYKYDMTLKNNTDVKLRVDYQFIILAGEVKQKVYDHSTELNPGEKRTETYYDMMSESDWKLVTGCHADWRWSEM